MRRAVLALVLAAFASGGLFADAAASAPAANAAEPYKASEFPGWALDLRRFEIVTIGAFPFAVFYSSFALDACRFFLGQSLGFSISAIGVSNPFVLTPVTAYDPAYAPWPFKSASSYSTSNDEKALTIICAATLALAVGVTDYFIVKAQRKAELRKKAALRTEAPPPASDPVPKPEAAPPGEESPDAAGGGLPAETDGGAVAP